MSSSYRLAQFAVLMRTRHRTWCAYTLTRESGCTMDIADLERRLLDLERRMSAVEGTSTATNSHAEQDVVSRSQSTELLVTEVSNKRLQYANHNAGTFQDYLWFDCSFRLSEQSKPTQAIKGTFEFCDIFGDPKFLIEYTMNDGLAPGRPIFVQGIGFEYNQFMADHQWVAATDLAHMKVRFRVGQAMYADGTSEWIS